MNMSSLIHDLDQRYKPLHLRYAGIYTGELPQFPPPPFLRPKKLVCDPVCRKKISTLIKLKPVPTTSPRLDLTQSPRFPH